MRAFIVLILSLVATTASSFSFRPRTSVAPLSQVVTTPTKLLEPKSYPTFTDDLDFELMDVAINRQLERFNKRSMNHIIKLGGTAYNYRHLQSSLIYFQKIMNVAKSCIKQNPQKKDRCYLEFDSAIRNSFLVYVPDVKETQKNTPYDNFARFTGYYTPAIKATAQRTAENRWGIYKTPKEQNLKYLKRDDIDFRDGLIGKGYDLFFTKDLFDLYLLHVEGGGKIELNINGKIENHYISYDSSNKQKWQFISVYMQKRGYINDSSVDSQREFLQKNPHLHQEIFSYCPGYVYFKITDTPPHGSDSVPLTDNRSIATDDSFYPLKGLLSFIKTERIEAKGPKQNHIEFSRFLIDQDTGGAIRGKARVDIYFGEGAYAEKASKFQNSYGELYFLVLKI